MGVFSRMGIRFQEQYLHPDKPDVLLERFRLIQKQANPKVLTQVVYHSVFIKMSPADHKWWSPDMTLNIKEHDEGSSITKVTGPNPGTFTLAMFVITFAIVIFFFALMFALSQIQLSTSPLISILVIAASIVLAFLVIAILGLGRKKALPQMEIMDDFVKELL